MTTRLEASRLLREFTAKNLHGRAHDLGRDAAIIGTVVEDKRGLVEMRTSMGGNRIVDWLTGEPLPRIC